MTLPVFCACGHEWDLHDLVSDQYGIETRVGRCLVGCPCPRFSPGPLPDGTYIRDEYGHPDIEGFDIIRYDPKGIERKCVMCQDRMTEFDGRYAVRLFPTKDAEPGAPEYLYDENPDDAAWQDAGQPLAFIASIACESCVLNAAGRAS